MAFKKSSKNIYQIISAAYQITKASWWFAEDRKENGSERFSIGTAKTKRTKQKQKPLRI